ncbi:hypothetical protein B0I35DRAFT_427708 [Stachybotrys elegans]|uniref:Uncharacterized protein n=1 Tax=Stachybotrys elegans TaxID=80388 RepID=A0A8K0WRT8_9HYPO|nr:hypothetical protein B0I35DRAFT_427708 [Stachybotrys elegans]
MRPLPASRVDTILERKSILIFDRGPLYLDYMKTLVPNNVASKQRSFKLPLELWLKIFKFAAEDKRFNAYRLVHPQSIERSSDGSTALLCAEITDWTACGQLDHPTRVRKYEAYLSDPYISYTWGDTDEERDRLGKWVPCTLPRPGDPVYRIPCTDLENNVLFESLTVPDVIARVERGYCHSCGGGSLQARYAGSSRGFQEKWFGKVEEDCGISIPCPVCLGVAFSERSMRWQRRLFYHGDSEGKQFDDWQDERLRELGYLA